jgi:DNA-binding NtrC family response regulator
MHQVVDQALRFARSSATVLLTGESGTGKELVARLIHDRSPRAGQRYERVNCAALSETLMESELFGHQRGAFTGAVETRLGRFEWASGGTLLLDEVSELPLSVQAKLLRVLEQEEFQRVGDNETRRSNVRVIATTNRILQDEVNRAGFRADLYHRLNVLEIRLPPLRERPDDIPLLIGRFLLGFREEASVSLRGVSPTALQVLTQYAWPGNVRELRNVVHRACVLATTELIQPHDLPPLSSGQDAMPPEWMHQTLESIERQVILQTLRRFRGNKTATALHLGVTARTLTNKLKRYQQQEAA